MICIECVKPAPLKSLIERRGFLGRCDYCQTEKKSIEKQAVFDYIYARVEENVASEDDLSNYEHGLLYECGSDFIAVQCIDIVLSEWFDLGEEPYFDELLGGVPHHFKWNKHGEETHFYSDDGLLEKNIIEDDWKNFIDNIGHTHRFFNPSAKEFLDSVFSFLSTGKNHLKPECIRVMENGQELYRARNAQNAKKAREIIADPAKQFGPTPNSLASSQRMTPSGISAMYCALERETCLSEIRSITGDSVISIGLTPITELRLLDLTRLDRVEPLQISILENGCLKNMHLKTFVDSLVTKMSKPKGRSDELSYLSTQVVFEYLRLRFGSQVDGLVFPSVQTGSVGTNVVLFPEASSISETQYTGPGSFSNFGEQPEKARGTLAIIENSAKFHKIVAIETKSRDYDHIDELFMSDLVRDRLGLKP